MLSSPIDVATQSTVEFVTAHAPLGVSVLEIGCGDGDVAVALRGRGYDVTGIESDPAAVQTSRAKGVPVLFGAWPTIRPSAVDVVLFTRSLHHIADLASAVRAARGILRGPRLLLIEDFDFASPDENTVTWLVTKAREAEAAGLVRPTAEAFATRIVRASDPMLAWRSEHDHDLHPIDRIVTAVRKHFAIVDQVEVPYTYRYLIPLIVETEVAAAWLRNAFAEEHLLGRNGDLELVGRRVTARDGRRPQNEAV